MRLSLLLCLCAILFTLDLVSAAKQQRRLRRRDGGLTTAAANGAGIIGSTLQGGAGKVGNKIVGVNMTPDTPKDPAAAHVADPSANPLSISHLQNKKALELNNQPPTAKEMKAGGDRPLIEATPARHDLFTVNPPPKVGPITFYQQKSMKEDED